MKVVVEVIARYSMESDGESNAKSRALHHFHSELEKWKQGKDWASRMWDIKVIGLTDKDSKAK